MKVWVGTLRAASEKYKQSVRELQTMRTQHAASLRAWQISDLASSAPVMIFQCQKTKILKKRKNRKNDFPREVKKFPSRGSKKNYVREIFKIPPNFVKKITL